MTIQTIISALQTRHAAITGVTTAPTAYPGSIASTDTPYILTDLATFTERHEAHGEELPIFLGTFRVRGFVKPTGQGTGIDEGKQLALTILERFLSSYRSDMDVTTTAYIRMDTGEGLRGAVRDGLAYGEETYYGFEIMLPIEERYA